MITGLTEDPYSENPPEPSGLNVDQSVQLAADQFEVAFNGSAGFVEKPTAADLRTGLLDPYDPYLTPEFIDHITDGTVDEHELHVEPGKMTSVIRGRNAMAKALETVIYVTYSVNFEQPGAPETPTTLAIQGFPSLPAIAGITVPEIMHGQWKVSTILADICDRIGLGLAYGGPDYQLREDVVVNGPVLSTIQSLIEPFNHFEPSKMDVWVENGTLIIRPRGTAGPGVASQILDAHDARITNLMLRQRDLDKVRVLRLIGSRTGTNLYFAIDPGDRTDVTTEEALDPLTNVVTMKIVTTKVVRILDNAVKSQTIQTFADRVNDQGVLTRGALVSEKVTVSDWDDLELAYPNVIVNQPKEHNRVITESGFNQAIGSEHTELVPMNRTSIMHHYNLTGYLTMQNTRKETWDTTPVPFGVVGWVLDSAESKQYEDNGAGMYCITTTQFGADGTPGDCRRTTANGTRPGGPGRRAAAGKNTNNEEPVTYAAVISLDVGAKDMTIQNKNLLPEHLAIIAAQAQAASGAVETEVSFTAAGMPWIKRGQYMQITGLHREDGVTEIPLGAGLVTDARIEYREAEGNPTYLSIVKYVYWETN